MEYRKLGQHGIRVSEVSLGGWLTHGRSIDDGTTDAIVHRAFDLGINLFDTADAYNAGEAELSLGKSISGFRRADLVLATKCFFPMSDRPNDRGLSRKHISESVHASLKRLGTDYIDLMQFHRFDQDTPLEETARAIEDLIRQGKVLYWGVSEWRAEQISDVVGICDRLGFNRPACNQPSYSMLNRSIENGVLGTCERHGLGLIVFSPLAQGVLTGKYLPGQPIPAGSRGSDSSSNMWMDLSDASLTKVQNLKAFVEAKGYSMEQFALAWCLRQPGLSSVIIGATSTEQVDKNVKASGLKLDASVWEEAEALLK